MITLLQMPSTLPHNTIICYSATCHRLSALGGTGLEPGWDKKQDAAMLRRESTAQPFRAFGF